MTAEIAAQSEQTVKQQFWELIKKTDKENPKKEDVAALRKMLREHSDLWQMVGDMAIQAAIDLIHGIQASAPMKESLEQGWIEIQAELGYKEASKLEQLLIEQVALCWLRMNLTEYRYTRVTNGSLSIAQASFWERKLSAAQQRYLRACETLARVRRLARNTPALQINFAADGGQQVNVAS